MRYRQSGKTYYSVHRSAYIVRHIGKKYAFCLACSVSLHQRVLKQCFLLHIAAHLFVNASESDNNILGNAVTPAAYAHDLHLIVDDFSVIISTVIDMKKLFFLKRAFYPLRIHRLTHKLLVFLMDITVYISIHALFKKNFVSEYFVQGVIMSIVHTKETTASRLYIKVTHKIKVRTQRLNQFCLTLFGLLE